MINCTGPFSDKIRNAANRNLPELIVPVQGDHISLPNNMFKGPFGIINQSKDGRIMYYLPWNDVVLAGTTEDTLEKIVTHPLPKVDKIAEIISNFSETFPD